MPEPPGELRDLVDAAIGGPATYRSRGWSYGISDVWEVRSDNGTGFFLKRHKQVRKFVRERRFYEEWKPHLPDMTPDLVAVFPNALLIGALPGEPMESALLEPEDERVVFVQAGRFLRALNAIPYTDERKLSLVDELADRMDTWLAHARDYLAAEDIRWLADRFRPHEAFGDLARVPCYGDFQPRNWIVDRRAESLRLGVFDFEHTRGDLWFLGIVKLWDRPWAGRPDLEASFWKGYGRTLTADEHEQLRQTILLHVIGVIVWSRKHGDMDYEAHGRQLLARLRRE